MQSQLSVDLIITQAGGTLPKKRQGQNVCEGAVITVNEENVKIVTPKEPFTPKKVGKFLSWARVPLAEEFRNLLCERAAFL